MTKEEAIKILNQEIDTIFHCISSYDDLHDKNIVDQIEAHKLAIKVLKQESKTGHWIDTRSGQECSECGEIQYGYDSFRHFCANCGAKMEE